MLAWLTANATTVLAGVAAVSATVTAVYHKVAHVEHMTVLDQINNALQGTQRKP